MNEQNVTAGFNAPASLVQAKISEGKAKTEMPVWKVLLLGIFAGMFIAFGASSSSLATVLGRRWFRGAKRNGGSDFSKPPYRQ